MPVECGTGQRLILTNVTYEQQGQYICLASNKINGHVREVKSDPVSLQVVGAPRVRYIREQKYTLTLPRCTVGLSILISPNRVLPRSARKLLYRVMYPIDVTCIEAKVFAQDMTDSFLRLSTYRLIPGTRVARIKGEKISGVLRLYFLSLNSSDIRTQSTLYGSLPGQSFDFRFI